ncbi:probable serine/threonine-protein kinase PIX13 isoform X2 [Quercus robur]|uniref:probable serine/threonine-protein kinase PIX13 isoform X2 n=1 Tax=Quercus robur TaxID=38942 RepID=UPI0021636368|nr:probable serine/threonine-protein kinase PIX13 isoform X2 [Quercus robur]
MGNCFGARVNNHGSPSITKHSSPETSSVTYSKPSLWSSKNSSSSNNATTQNSSAEINNINRVEEMPLPPPPLITGKVITPNLKMFTLAELKSATRNFRPDTVLGEGGFGRVFKGWIDETTYAPSKVGIGIAVAVKKSNPDSPQGLQEWQSEVKFLGKFSHPNLVRLLGYCWEDKEYLLVYEYMQKGSLENHLFRRGAEPLAWDVRLKIALGAARGLSFLHTSEKSVIYRDFKSSNILLDGNFNAKLSDFGLAKLGPVNGNSHVTTRVMGTYGYAAPEYVATGHLYVRSDVYGFGVVLLEMLTGIRALDPNRPSGEQNLVEWAKTSLSEKKKLKKIMDPRLCENYPIKGAFCAAQLIQKCLESDPKNRPSMNEVLEELEKINAIKEKVAEPKHNPKPNPKPNKRKEDRHQHHHNYHKSPIHQKHGVNRAGARA